MNGAPGQPGIMQPFLIPISLPGAGRSIVLQPGMSPAAFGMRPPASVSKMEPPPPVPVQQTPPVELYLCNTSRSAAGTASSLCRPAQSRKEMFPRIISILFVLVI